MSFVCTCLAVTTPISQTVCLSNCTLNQFILCLSGLTLETPTRIHRDQINSLYGTEKNNILDYY